MRLPTSWQEGALCTCLKDLNLTVASLERVAKWAIGTGCAESTSNIGSLSQDKYMERASFLSSLLKGLFTF
jgi:hypothetical protein